MYSKLSIFPFLNRELFDLGKIYVPICSESKNREFYCISRKTEKPYLSWKAYISWQIVRLKKGLRWNYLLDRLVGQVDFIAYCWPWRNIGVILRHLVINRFKKVNIFCALAVYNGAKDFLKLQSKYSYHFTRYISLTSYKQPIRISNYCNIFCLLTFLINIGKIKVLN